MNTTTAQPEVSLMRHVTARMKFVGYRTFQEVQFEGMRIDLVAITDDDLIAIHGKMQLTDALIEQGRLSQGVSNYTVLAVPQPKPPTSQQWADRAAIVAGMGLGLTTVYHGRVIEHIKPSPNHAAQPDRLRAALRAEQQEFAPAGSQSEMFTPERAWISAIRDYLDKCGDMRPIEADTLQAAGPERVPHNAVVRAVTKLVATGRIDFARIESRGGQTYLVKN